jgi:hypothetical protein
MGWIAFRLVNTLTLKGAGRKSRRLEGLHPGTPAIVYFTTAPPARRRSGLPWNACGRL